MKQLLMAIVAGITLSGSLHASTEVCIDHVQKSITLSAHYYFYGDEATEARAKACVDEINQHFNNGHRIQLNQAGDWLKINAKVSYTVISEYLAAQFMSTNSSTKYNFVRIDTPPAHSRVTISEHGLNSNYGYFLTKNNLGTSTTCAHEFAHGLGLKHLDPCDWRGKGVPPIMAARGCLVDKQYQYDPKAKAGAQGGTVDPSKRKVIAKEFSLINMGDLKYKWVTPAKECASQGVVVRRIYNKDGSVYTPTPTLPSSIKW